MINKNMTNLDRGGVRTLTINLKELKERECPYAAKAVDRILRLLTEDNQVWPMTNKVEKLLKENNLYPTDGLTYNKLSNIKIKLKKIGCESIYFEHWKEIKGKKIKGRENPKSMINELLAMNLSDDLQTAIDQVYEYLVKNSDCFFRLENTEKHLQPHEYESEYWMDIQ